MNRKSNCSLSNIYFRIQVEYKVDWGEEYGDNRYDWVSSRETDCPGFVVSHLNDQLSVMRSEIDDLYQAAADIGVRIRPTGVSRYRQGGVRLYRHPAFDQQTFQRPTLNQPTFHQPTFDQVAHEQPLYRTRPHAFYQIQMIAPQTFASDSFPFQPTWPSFSIRQPIRIPGLRSHFPTYGQPQVIRQQAMQSSSIHLPMRPRAITSFAHSSRPIPTSTVTSTAFYALDPPAIEPAQLEMPMYVQPSLNTRFAGESVKIKKALCDICGYSAIVAHVKRHILRKHAKCKLVCSRCKKSFSTKDDLHRHQNKTKNKCIQKK